MHSTRSPHHLYVKLISHCMIVGCWAESGTGSSIALRTHTRLASDSWRATLASEFRTKTSAWCLPSPGVHCLSSNLISLLFSFLTPFLFPALSPFLFQLDVAFIRARRVRPVMLRSCVTFRNPSPVLCPSVCGDVAGSRRIHFPSSKRGHM